MTTMDKRKLEQEFYLVIEGITFANDEVGDPVNGRTATSIWAQDAEVVFRGKLKHILLFGLLAFDVSSVAILEKFSLIPARDFLNIKNLGDTDIVDVVNLDPTVDEGIILDEDLTFLARLTDNFRLDWSAPRYIIVQEKATPTNRAFYKGTVLEALAYVMQVHSTGNAVVRTLYDFALLDPSSQVNKGITWVEISGSQGPVELAKAHVSLGNLILGV